LGATCRNLSPDRPAPKEIDLHYYQFSIGDYRRDTTHLTLLEHGIYRQLLDTYYLSESPLCADDAILMRTHSIRTPDEIQAYKNVINDFFFLHENAYHHKGCDKIIEKYRAKSEKASLSARARWDKDANALRTQSDRYANHKPITNNQEPITNIKPSRKKPALDDVCQSDFDVFWSSYPKKTGKDAALKAWKLKKPRIDDVMFALSWQRNSEQWQKNGGQFIPNPATYINQGRWQDEPVQESEEAPF